MELTQLIESLKSFSELLSEEGFEKIDPGELRQVLREGAAVLAEILPALSSAEKLKQLFEGELLRKLRAVGELTGRKSPLMERLISSAKLSFEELKSLKGDIDREFEAAFAQKLKQSVSLPEGERASASSRSKKRGESKVIMQAL